MPRPGEYPNTQNIVGTEDLTLSMVDDPGLKVINARNLVRFMDGVSPPTGVPVVGVPPGQGVWTAPWITSEDAPSGMQDIARGGLRLVTPTGAGQASWATQEISSINVALRASVLLPTLGHFFSSVYFRASTDFASKLQFKHVVSATGAHSLILSEWVDNVETTLAVSAVNYGVDGIEYKLSVVDDKFQAKLWPTGTAEPLEWDMNAVVPVRQTRWLALVAKGGDAGAAREIVYRDLSILPITVTQPPDNPVPQTQTFTTGTTAGDVGFTMTRGVFAPTGGVLRATTAGVDAIGFYTFNTGSNDHYTQADLVTGSSITGIYAGLTVRHSADGETFYLMETVNGGSAIRLMRSVNGQYTQVGTNVAVSIPTSSSTKLRLEVQNNSQRGYINDVLVISASDTTLTTGVHGGVKLSPGASLASVAVDNFTVGALTSTPTVSRTTLVSQTLPPGTPVSSLGFTTNSAATATPARFFYGGTGIFQTPIAQSEVTVHPRSTTIMATLANGSNDRGLTTEAYAMSVVDVDPAGDTYQVIIRNDSVYNGSWGGSGSWGFNNITYLYPTIKIQPGAQVPSGTDRALIIRDWANGRALSFWVCTIDETNKRILADWGGAFPANSDGNSIAPNYSPGPYGVDFGSINRTTGAGAVYGHTAVGISGYQGNVTFADMERGYIDHALVFATKMIAGPPQSPGTAFFYPATTNDGNELGADRIEAGSRIQLMSSDATINAISNPGQRMLARALKDYGAFVVDYAGAMATFVSQRPRQGVSSELSLFSQYGFNVSGDGWNPLTQINWNDVRVLITTKGNQVGLVGSSGVSLNNTDLITSDHWVEADLVVGSTVANQTVGVVARATSNNSYYVFETSGSSSSLRLRAVVAGSTATTWTGAFTPSPNTTYKLRLDVVGSSINCYVDGVLLISVTDTTLQTQTKGGIVVARIGNQLETVTLDNFKAGNFLTGGSNGGGEPPTGGLAFIQGFSTGSTGADANFTMLRGALTIASGTLRASALSTEIDGYHTTDLGSEHHYVQSDCVIGASDTGTYWAINARMATSGLTYYSVEVQPGRGVNLLRVVGGTYTSLGFWASGWALNSTHTLKLECNGSTITVSADGVAVITVTDGGITAGSKVGVHIFTSGAVTNMVFDNFGGKAVAWNGTTVPPPVVTPPTGGGGSTTPPPTSTSEAASVGDQGSGYYYSNFDNATNAASAGLAETPPNGLHGFNVPIRFSGGAARPDAVGVGAGYGDCIAFPSQADITADQFARAKIRIGSSGSTGGATSTGTFTGVMVRVTPTSGSGYASTAYSWYKFETYGYSANTVRWTKVVNGVNSGGQNYSWQLNPNTTYDFYLEVRGNTLTGYIDGVFVFTANDFDLTTGKPGISLYNDVTDQATVLDFEAGGFPAGSGGTTTTNLFVGSLSGAAGWVPAPQESGTNNIVGTGSFLAF